MTKFNVGDKVRVVNVRAIGYGYKHYYDGMITEVVRICPEGFVYLRNKDGYEGISVRQAEISGIRLISKSESTTNERLTEAEAKIASLEAEVFELAARLDVVVDASKPTEIPKPRDIHAYLASVKARATTITPNHRRASVIKQAKDFVADLESTKKCSAVMNIRGGLESYYPHLDELSFVVNSDKGTVVALLKYRKEQEVWAKAFAKCDPSDVFNADIGKAIAAGRLYGVDIPEEFLKAVQPTEVVVGMRVRGGNGYGQYDSSRIFTLYKTREDGWAYREDYKDSAGDWITEDDIGLITEDTDAIYS